MTSPFRLVAPYEAAGDQSRAIAELAEAIRSGETRTTLLGVTGSGKTYVMSRLIAELDRPALILSPNKTLAAQLYSEFKEFFPDNAVEYFVSYYDYYQPEAYIPASDTFIEKDSQINARIDRLRLAATASLLARRDAVVVASISCIYGLGEPGEFERMTLPLWKGAAYSREDILSRLVEMQYERGEDLTRGKIRARGNAVDVHPADREEAIRIVLDDEDRVAAVHVLDAVTGEVLASPERITIFPAKHYVTSLPRLREAIATIQIELKERLAELHAQGKNLEAERLGQRTRYDLEMLAELGFCSGIENYSRHLSGRKEGEPPYTLLDYFPKDHLLFVDESHVAVPQIRGMYNGDRARKEVLVEHGFRLPSALDNRPLKSDEFWARAPQTVFVSATPGEYERAESRRVVELVVRPTGLVDPPVEIRPAQGQVKSLVGEILATVARKERVLVTTLTKKTAEELADYLRTEGIRVTYLHSEIETLERIEILRSLRAGEVDVLVGINLLREGLDLPEVSLVAILDADREGFLRSETSLIQTAGRAARHLDGKVILFADRVTGSMERALGEMSRRRERQLEYNRVHGITPRGITKALAARSALSAAVDPVEAALFEAAQKKEIPVASRVALLDRMKTEMDEAAGRLDFERAAELRDRILALDGKAPLARRSRAVKGGRR